MTIYTITFQPPYWFQELIEYKTVLLLIKCYCYKKQLHSAYIQKSVSLKDNRSSQNSLVKEFWGDLFVQSLNLNPWRQVQIHRA